MSHAHFARSGGKRLGILLIALVLLVPLAAWVVVQLHGPQTQNEAFANLSAIARLKSDQIESWLGERNKDGQLLAADAEFARQVERLVGSGPAQNEARAWVKQRLTRMRQVYGYEGLSLLTLDGLILLSDGTASPSTDLTMELLRRQVLSSRAVVRGRLRVDADQDARLDWYVPVFDATDPGQPSIAPLIAIVAMAVAPQRSLFAAIQTWPTASPSGETLLVRRDGESAVFLNTLKHRSDTSMRLRLPMAESALPAAAALLSSEPGAVEGVDYRGVAVLAAYQSVAGTDWSVVAKLDRYEVLAPVYQLAGWISAVTGLAVLAVAWALGLFWRQLRQTQRLQDITQHQLAIDKSLRQSQLYAALSECNQAVLRCASQEQFLARVCLTVVSLGGMKMAWVGMLDAQSGNVLPVASFGANAPDVTAHQHSPVRGAAMGWPDADTAMQEDRAVWCENRLEVSACLALHRGGEVVGVFVLDADARDALDQDARNLIRQMASAIDFALRMLDLDALRERTDALLYQSQTQLELVIRGSGDAPWDWKCWPPGCR